MLFLITNFTLHFFSFLDDVCRIAARNYEPSDDDVLRARLRTIGVQEYKFTIEKGQRHVYCFSLFSLSILAVSRTFSKPSSSAADILHLHFAQAMR
jgi:hypothetical protein